MSLAGGPFRSVATTTAPSVKAPLAVPCLATVVAVAARFDVFGWTSDPSPSVALPRRRVRGDRCRRAPKVTVPMTAVPLAALRAAYWEVPLAARLRGAGWLHVELVGGDDRRVVVSRLAVASGRVRGIAYTLPLWARAVGTYRLEVTASAPSGRLVAVAAGRISVLP